MLTYQDKRRNIMEKQLTNRFKNFEEKLKYLENMPPQTFLDIYDQTYDFENLRYIHNFLYHGIRFQNHLEKLESIFKDRAILAGNYQNQHSIIMITVMKENIYHY